MSSQICIEASDGFGSADSANQVFAREKFKGPVDGRGRQSPEVTQSFIDGVGGWMREIFYEGAINGESLRCDPNSASPAQLLEIIAPLVYFRLVPEVGLLAINYHLRIITI